MDEDTYLADMAKARAEQVAAAKAARRAAFENALLDYDLCKSPSFKQPARDALLALFDAVNS